MDENVKIYRNPRRAPTKILIAAFRGLVATRAGIIRTDALGGLSRSSHTPQNMINYRSYVTQT